MTLGRIGGIYAALWAGNDLADHWIQTDHQATTKAEPGRKGQVACAAHVATLTATQALALGLVCAATGERLNPRRVAAGFTLSAVTHYWADRRTPLARLATKTRKGAFVNLGDPKAAPTGTGAYALDQALHHTAAFIAATIIGGN